MAYASNVVASGDKNHKCPAHVPIHVIEESLDALEETGQDTMGSEDEVEEMVMAVGHSTNSVLSRRTMKWVGKVGKTEVLILVDSGSVGTFINEQLASKLHLSSSECSPTKFIAADGSPMICNQRINNLQWSVQGHTFTSSVGILLVFIKCK